MKDIKFDLQCNHIGKVLNIESDKIKIEYPKHIEHGDLSINCYIIAKLLQEPIQDIQNILVQELKNVDYIENVKIVNGYVNIFLNINFLMFYIELQDIEFKKRIQLPKIQIWRSFMYDWKEKNESIKFTSEDIQKYVNNETL